MANARQRRRRRRRRRRQNNKVNQGRNQQAQVNLSFERNTPLTPSQRQTQRQSTRLFNDRAETRANNQERSDEFKKNRRRYRRISRKITRQERRGNRGRVAKLYSKLDGVVHKEQAAITGVRDQRRLERTAELQANYIEVIGETQRIQDEQASMLEASIREQSDIFNAAVKEQTSLQRQILEEQQKQAELEERRATRARARAENQNRLQQIGVAQQGLISRGRQASAMERRRTAPAIQIAQRTI